MANQDIEKILATLADHEARLTALEKPAVTKTPTTYGGNKERTVREIVRGKKLNNGSEKIAVIVGYHEKILGKLINRNGLRQEWQDAKMEGSYKTNLLDDASGVYVRVHSNGDCDLTQSGETFFDNFLKS